MHNDDYQRENFRTHDEKHKDEVFEDEAFENLLSAKFSTLANPVLTGSIAPQVSSKVARRARVVVLRPWLMLAAALIGIALGSPALWSAWDISGLQVMISTFTQSVTHALTLLQPDVLLSSEGLANVAALLNVQTAATVLSPVAAVMIVIAGLGAVAVASEV